MRPLILLIAACLLLAACTAQGPSTNTLLASQDRRAAPDVVGETLEGETIALADLGTPTVVNFWASWCGPCVAEAPELAAVAQRYADDGVDVVGVNVQDSVTNARRFEADLDIPFPSWFDPSSQIAAAFGGVGPTGLPTTLVLDAEGRVAARLFGAVTAPQLHGYLDPLLAEAGRPVPGVPGPGARAAPGVDGEG
jgi:thiol-disulfide isomerase/thioredoxin